jgi:hypothetical protein
MYNNNQNIPRNISNQTPSTKYCYPKVRFAKNKNYVVKF